MKNMIKATIIVLALIALLLFLAQKTTTTHNNSQQQTIKPEKKHKAVKINAEKAVKKQGEKTIKKALPIAQFSNKSVSKKTVKPKQKKVTKKDKTTTINKTKPLTNAGIKQKGINLPLLNLQMDSTTIKQLLKQKKAYLVTTLEKQNYLIQIDSNSLYEKIILTKLSHASDLSERYLSLSHNQFEEEDIDNLDNQVILRTGINASPEYRLVFSTSFSEYLNAVQIESVKEQKLDLVLLKKEEKSIQMQGLLKVNFSSVELIITDTIIN